MTRREFHTRLYVRLLVAFLLVSVSARAQWTDTLHKVMHGKIYPTASFDSRNSFVSSQRAHIWGIKAGVDFSGLMQLGIGYNFHDRNLEKRIYYTNVAGERDSSMGTLRLRYFSYYLRYVYYYANHWRFSIMPLQVGLGNSKYTYPTSQGERETDKRFVMLYEPGLSVSYKFFKWLGVGGDLGYRIMLKNNPAIPERFNSPTYSFYFIIYWGEIYKLVLPETKLAKML